VAWRLQRRDGKEGSMTPSRFALVLATLVLGLPLGPVFAQDTASPATSTAPAHAMMQSCEHHQAMEAALARVAKLAADTKSSKDVTKLQNALNEVAAEVKTIQENGTKCSAMMDKMKSPAKDADPGAPHKH
jgi:uncharacterized protein (DUF1501 family)